ncbi:ABC transporter substrate-binding protein [Nocardioides sp. NPDC051685]|uniref:ABC transporter substrate-binding protein n=1 Tax=Nocardioides sp. NPDC051685 TaxID=3364334 RepID=UPI0037A3EE82
MKLKSAVKKLFVVASVAPLLLIGACGGSGSGPAHAVKAGETLVIADETQPLSGLDPIMAQAFDAKRMVSQFYEGLLRLSADGRTIEPALAENWEQKSPTRYEFELRKGVTFHDGAELTADDVVFSMERLLDPEQNSPYRTLYRIDAVEAMDESHVAITLKRPQSSLLRLLAQPWSAGIVDEGWATKVTDDQIKTQENGTGPYRLDSFKEGSTIMTSAFADYWGGEPSITSVEYRVMPDESTRVQALRSGAVDMTQVRLPKNYEQLDKQGFSVGDPYRVGAYWLAMDMTDGPLADERVRQALNLGIDRKQLIEIGSQGAGVLSGAVPPGDPYGTEADESTPYYKHDVKRAKELLAEAGAENLTLTLAIRSDSPEKIATAQLVKEQLAQIGVTLEIKQSDWSRLVSEITSGQWKADLVQLTSALNADPSQYLDLWFAKGGAATKVKDETLWKMMDSAVEGDLSDDERTSAYAEIDTYIAEHAYLLVPYASVQVYEVWAPGLDYQPEPSGTRLMLHDATVS